MLLPFNRLLSLAPCLQTRNHAAGKILPRPMGHTIERLGCRLQPMGILLEFLATDISCHCFGLQLVRDQRELFYGRSADAVRTGPVRYSLPR
jgi:hypothetical protein